MSAPALLTLLTFGVSAGLRAQGPQAFRVSVDAVQVDVFVGHGTEAIEGLTMEDFLIYDNDVPQTVVGLQSVGLPVNAILALDTSYSLRGENLQELKKAVRALLDALQEEDGAALVTFSNSVSVTRAFDGDLAPLLDVVGRISGAGATSLNDGIFVGLKLAEKLDHSFLVVFTDGEDRFSWLSGDQVLHTAMRSETPVFSVITRPEPGAPSGHLAFLSRLADGTGGERYVARSTRELSEAFAKVLARMKQRYVLTYFPTDQEVGWHSLRVRLRSGRADVRARRGYHRALSP